MRFLVDCDGPLSDFSLTVLDFVQRKTGIRFTYEDLTNWDVFASIGMSYLEDDFKKEIENNGLCLAMRETLGSKTGMSLLKKRGEVFVVTATYDARCWEYDRRRWLKETFDINKDHIVQTHAKHVVNGDFFIDDKPETIVKWCCDHPNGYGLLWGMPHNENFNVAKRYNIIRVLSWPHVIYTVDRLKENL